MEKASRHHLTQEIDVIRQVAVIASPRRGHGHSVGTRKRQADPGRGCPENTWPGLFAVHVPRDGLGGASGDTAAKCSMGFRGAPGAERMLVGKLVRLR